MSEIRPLGPIPTVPSFVLDASRINAKAPSDQVSSAPFNFGEQLLPHVVTFQGIVSSVSRVYRYADEAMKHSQENARFMRNDPIVMEPIEQRRRAVALLNWHLETDDQDNPTEKKLAENMTKILKRIPYFTKFRESLMDAVWYGKYAVQWAYAWDRVHGVEAATSHFGNQIISRWLPVNGDKLVFRYDDGTREYNPNQVGIRVGAGYTAGDKLTASRLDRGGNRKIEPTDYGLAYFLEPWERELLAIHKHMIEDGEYEDPQSAGRIHGVGVRSRIYWIWYMKQELHAWLMEFLERNAAGVELWYYPYGNPEAEAKMRTAAEERIGNARNIILIPRPIGEGDSAGYGVDVIPPNMAGAEIIKAILEEYFGDLIMRYVLGQTMTNKSQSVGLGSDLPQVQLGTYLQIIRYDAINLSETMTEEVVKPLVRRNYPSMQSIPLRFVIDTESEDTESKLNAWKIAYDCGLKMKAADWYKLLGAAKPEEDDETIENPVTKQQDRLYDQWQANRQGEVGGGLPGQGGLASPTAQAQGGLGEPEPQTGGGDFETALQQFAQGGQPTGQPGQPGRPEDYAAAESDEAKPDNAKLPIGTGNTPSINKMAIVKGTIHEMEHTQNVNVAREIAIDHLKDRPDYYEVLERAMAAGPATSNEDSERVKMESYSRMFDSGRIYRQMLELYYKQSSPVLIEEFWAGQPGEITVVQDDRPMRYSRGSRGNVTVEVLGQSECYRKASNQSQFDWQEKDHPRGQPENAGEFTSKGQQSKQSKQSKQNNIKTAKQNSDATKPKKLYIPPGWRDVKISDDPNAIVLATGLDSKGRRQTIYSPTFVAKQAIDKFNRIRELIAKTQAIEKENMANLNNPDVTISEAASCLLLIQRMGIRPGSDRDTKADKQAYGATTLRAEHVVQSADGVWLNFVGKKGVNINLKVNDSQVANMLLQRKATANRRGGKLFNINDSVLRDYSHKLDGGKFKPKDFRTALGTQTAMEVIEKMPYPKNEKEYKAKVKDVATIVSSKLGNTPVIALQSYINPSVFSEWKAAI